MTTEETNIQYINIPAPTEDVQYADFLTRFGALFIDCMLILSPMLLLVYILLMTRVFKLNGWLFSLYPNEFNAFLRMFILWVGPILICSLIYALFEISRFQGTPGKIIGGIKVVDEHGNKLTFWRAFGRNASKAISIIIIFIGFLMALFTDRKQALHDMIAKTYVIKK